MGNQLIARRYASEQSPLGGRRLERGKGRISQPTLSARRARSSSLTAALQSEETDAAASTWWLFNTRQVYSRDCKSAWSICSVCETLKGYLATEGLKPKPALRALPGARPRAAGALREPALPLPAPLHRRARRLGARRPRHPAHAVPPPKHFGGVC